jgi:hypothetical protein
MATEGLVSHSLPRGSNNAINALFPLVALRKTTNIFENQQKLTDSVNRDTETETQTLK